MPRSPPEGGSPAVSEVTWGSAKTCAAGGLLQMLKGRQHPKFSMAGSRRKHIYLTVLTSLLMWLSVKLFQSSHEQQTSVALQVTVKSLPSRGAAETWLQPPPPGQAPPPREQTPSPTQGLELLVASWGRVRRREEGEGGGARA